MSETCGDYGGTAKSTGQPCERPAGWGTDFQDGKCKFHRGTNSDGSSHTDNTHAVTHGAYADQNRFYSDVLDDEMRAVVDAVYESYLDAYTDHHGEPPLGHDIELFNIAVNIGKQLHADNWLSEKAGELESGNPLIDKETKVKAVGDQIIEERRYRESAVISAQQKLSRERRQWLKDLGLLEDAQGKMADALENGIVIHTQAPDDGDGD